MPFYDFRLPGGHGRGGSFATTDRVDVFPIRHGAGLMDFSITGGDRVYWVFPDGSTSTADRPSVSLSAGVTYLYCANFSDPGIAVSDRDTGDNYIGRLGDLPLLTHDLTLSGCTDMTGDLSDLPPLTNGLSLSGGSNITGDLADLPPVTMDLALPGCQSITGDLSDLPRVTSFLDLYGCVGITGDLSDLPPVTYYLSLSACANITGDLSDIPELTNYLSLNNCVNVTGSLVDLPPLSNQLSLINCANVTGAYTAVNGSNVPSGTDLTGTGLSAADMDSTLAAYAAGTKDDGTFTATGKTRTAASDAAVSALTARGWSIEGITKV